MRCVVSTCDHDSNNATAQGITFHLFPSDPLLQSSWLKAIDKEGWSPEEDSSVCSYHFLINDLYLAAGGLCKVREGAVPMILKHNDELMMPCDIKVCRICFATDSNLYSMKLFKNLHEAYGALSGLKIEIEDNMPPYLCSECSHQMMNCFTFRNKIIQSHLTLQEILKKNKCITLELIEYVNKNQTMVDSNHGKAQNNKYLYDVEVELVKNEDPSGQIYPTDLPSSYEHFIHYGIKKEKDDMLNASSPKDQDVNHDIVYSPSLHKYIMRENVKIERDDEYNEDNHCQDTTNYDMIPSSRFGDEDYSLDSNRALRDGDCTDQGADKATAIMETSRHPIQSKLNNHSKLLPEADLFTNDNLSSDVRGESTEKPFTCDICNKSFSQKSWLMNHTRIHSGERPYSCDVCKKSFNDKSNYRKHLRIHSGEKPYPCTFCDKAFNRKNYLENHLRTHSGEKPYACSICNKVFGHKHHLKSHLRIHSGEKPYSCHICHKEFSEKSNLHMHLKVHSGDKLYSCGECKIAFSTKYLLKCHSKVHLEKSMGNTKIIDEKSKS